MSAVQKHPVADLLTPEMKARVRAATFGRDRNGVSAQDTRKSDGRRCPLAVAAGMDCSIRAWVYRALGVAQPHDDVESFMAWADSIYSDPSETYALLGCDDPERGDRP